MVSCDPMAQEACLSHGLLLHSSSLMTAFGCRFMAVGRHLHCYDKVCSVFSAYYAIKVPPSCYTTMLTPFAMLLVLDPRRKDEEAVREKEKEQEAKLERWHLQRAFDFVGCFRGVD